MFIATRPCPNCGTRIDVPTRSFAVIACTSCGTRLQQKHRSTQLGLSLIWIMIAVALITWLSDQMSGLLTVFIIGAWIVLYAIVSRFFIGWEAADQR